MKWGLFLFCA